MGKNKIIYICKCGNVCENGICIGCMEKMHGCKHAWIKIFRDMDRIYKKYYEKLQ